MVSQRMSHVGSWLLVVWFLAIADTKEEGVGLDREWMWRVGEGMQFYQFVQTSQIWIGWHLSGVHCYGLMRMTGRGFRCCVDRVEGC